MLTAKRAGASSAHAPAQTRAMLATSVMRRKIAMLARELWLS
jgi:hypothetical protein